MNVAKVRQSYIEKPCEQTTRRTFFKAIESVVNPYSALMECYHGYGDKQPLFETRISPRNKLPILS